MRFDIIPPIVIGRRAVDQVIVGTMKLAGYYLMDISRCGENYHLGNERWKTSNTTLEEIDQEWNMRFYTKDIRQFAIIASYYDYRIYRDNLNKRLIHHRKTKRGLKKLFPRPYFLQINRKRIKPR